ncbi:MAG: hypothetical protein ACK5XA_05515, partial [Tagaea sp.]
MDGSPTPDLATLRQKLEQTNEAAPVEYKNLVFNYCVDLSFLKTKRPVAFLDCCFPEGIDLSGASLVHLRLTESKMAFLRAPSLSVATDMMCTHIESGPIDLEDSRIDGDLALAGARIQAAKTVATSQFYDLQLAIAPKAPPKPVSPTMPDHSAISIDRATIGGRVFLQASRWRCAEVSGSVSLRSASIGGVLSLKGARLCGTPEPPYLAIQAQGLRVAGAVHISAAIGASNEKYVFVSVGKLDFSGTTLNGGFALREARRDDIGPDRDLAPPVGCVTQANVTLWENVLSKCRVGSDSSLAFQRQSFLIAHFPDPDRTSPGS